MADRPTMSAERAIAFGPFRLFPAQQLLLEGETPVRLGSRAFEILTALVERPGEVVSKDELIARVWPNTFIDENTLRVHIAGLRKALGDGQRDRRYVTSIPGRGYCFVEPVSRSAEAAAKAATTTAPPPDAYFLPARSTRMVGREVGVLTLSTQLTASRFVTIVGPGGVGKTTVAVAVAHDLLETFEGAVLFVDLGVLREPGMVATSLASMLGLSVPSDNPTPALAAYLRDKRLLLILDNCEHVIEAAASLAALIFITASQLHILATSREALRVEGERIYRLDSLACPPDDPQLTAAAACAFPAIQLFMERAAANGTPLDLNDADAAIMAGICRKLDGIPLAIELAASRVDTYGLRQTAALLDQRLALLWQGRRTAPPRQQTLRATLDWSYGLLSDLERRVLRRLAVFVGQFTLDAALAVVPGAAVDKAHVFATIESLIAKSIVATRPTGAMVHYRLLETTRAYALEIDAEGDELTDLAACHATHYQRWLEQDGGKWLNLTHTAERAHHLASLGNVRAALEWCFGAGGNTEIGVRLAAAAVPVFSAMSLLSECHRWSERAILALGEALRGGPEEMRLQTALGTSLMFTRGVMEEAGVALNRSLALADEHGDGGDQLRLLSPLHMFHHQTGRLEAALHDAKRASALAATLADPIAIAVAHTLSGFTLHFMGDFASARVELEAALQRGPVPQPTSTRYFGFARHHWAGAALAKNLWVQGYPDQAVECARQCVEDVASMDLPVPLSIALILAITVFLWTGDLKKAEAHTDWLISLTKTHAIGPYLAQGIGFRGELAICEGDAKAGVSSLRSCIEELRAMRYHLMTTPFTIPLIQGLAATGQLAEGLALLDETIQWVETNKALSYLPELLRVKGSLLLSTPQPASEDAETCFLRSLEASRGQGALSWELRTATSLASLWHGQGRADEARGLLAPIHARFTEGFDTADLMAAKHLLDTLP